MSATATSTATSGGVAARPPRRSRRYLADAERAVLLEVARRPGLSNAQVVAIFRARTGRTIARSTAGEAKRGDLPPGPPAWQLTGPERAGLEWLIAESGPGFNSREVARQFAALAGRPIHPSRVRRVAAAIGIATGPAGMPRGIGVARRAAGAAGDLRREKEGRKP